MYFSITNLCRCREGRSKDVYVLLYNQPVQVQRGKNQRRKNNTNEVYVL